MVLGDLFNLVVDLGELDLELLLYLLVIHSMFKGLLITALNCLYVGYYLLRLWDIDLINLLLLSLLVYVVLEELVLEFVEQFAFLFLLFLLIDSYLPFVKSCSIM